MTEQPPSVSDIQLWEEYCDRLKRAGAQILREEAPLVTCAEGWRYLSRLTRAGLEWFVEFADPSKVSIG